MVSAYFEVKVWTQLSKTVTIARPSGSLGRVRERPMVEAARDGAPCRPVNYSTNPTVAECDSSSAWPRRKLRS
jgi:hypothetical protein